MSGAAAAAGINELPLPDGAASRPRYREKRLRGRRRTSNASWTLHQSPVPPSTSTFVAVQAKRRSVFSCTRPFSLLASVLRITYCKTTKKTGGKGRLREMRRVKRRTLNSVSTNIMYSQPAGQKSRLSQVQRHRSNRTATGAGDL